MTITVAAWPARWRFRRRRPRHSVPKRRRAALPRHAAWSLADPADLRVTPRPRLPVRPCGDDATVTDLALRIPRYFQDPDVQEYCEALRVARVMSAGVLLP